MKTTLLKKMMYLFSAIMLLGTLSLTSCKDDDPDPEPQVEDGLYIKGAGTALTALGTKGLMKNTRNEILNDEANATPPTVGNRESLYEMFIPVKAGAEGFSIVQVSGKTQKTYGPGADFALVSTPGNDEPKEGLWKGKYAESTTPFTVPADGMYHVVIDTKLGKVSIASVKYWGLIGAATPGGWTDDTKLMPKAFDLNTMTFEVTDVKMSKGQFKFRFAKGWKILLDTTEVLNVGTKKGVNVNTNFGNKIEDLKPGGNNIDFAVPAIYTAKAVWTLGAGWVMTLTKTGDVPTIDYSNYEMGIIGNSYNKTDGTPAAWDENFGTHKPVVNGKLFTWTYNISMFPGAFKFRQGTDWAGKSLGYGDCVWAGAAAGDFSNDGGNIKISTTGNYTLVLVIDAATETYTVTCTKN